MPKISMQHAGCQKIIEAVTADVQVKYSEKIVTEIQPLSNYVLAEDYHQDYLKNNPGGYCHIDLSTIPREKPFAYRTDYPKAPVEEIKKKLTDLQFSITQENFTERAFENQYWDNKEEGLYVDTVTGVPHGFALSIVRNGCHIKTFGVECPADYFIKFKIKVI